MLQMAIGFMIFALFSCETMQTISTQPSSSIKFKRTMPIVINNYAGSGMMTVPVSKSYKIKINVTKRTKLIKLHTCHRELSIERKTSNWGSKTQEIVLEPVSVMESTGYCPIEIGAFDLKGKHSWGLIEIINESMQADTICNGKEKKAVGVSICQSKSGLIQRIDFNEDVMASVAKGCPQLRRIGNSFEYKTPVGDCVYLFGSKKTKGKFHRHTVFGYETILLDTIKPSNQ